MRLGFCAVALVVVCAGMVSASHTPYPDFHVELSVSAAEPTEPGSRVVTIDVSNVGAGSSTPGTVFVGLRFRDPLVGGSCEIGEVALPALDPGGSIRLVGDWTAASGVGIVSVIANAYSPDNHENSDDDEATQQVEFGAALPNGWGQIVQCGRVTFR